MSVDLTILEVYIFLYFTWYILQPLVQRNFYNQPADICLKIKKNVCEEVTKIHAKSDLTIVVCFVLDIYV